jgi:hypothetical protein
MAKRSREEIVKSQLTALHYQWEFLSRNEEYKKDRENFQKDVEEAMVKGENWEDLREEFLKKWQWLRNPVDELKEPLRLMDWPEEYIEGDLIKLIVVTHSLPP